MGKNGFIILVNETDADWQRTSQSQHQMNIWNFPEVIKAKTQSKNKCGVGKWNIYKN